MEIQKFDSVLESKTGQAIENLINKKLVKNLHILFWKIIWVQNG